MRTDRAVTMMSSDRVADCEQADTLRSVKMATVSGDTKLCKMQPFTVTT